MQGGLEARYPCSEEIEQQDPRDSTQKKYFYHSLFFIVRGGRGGGGGSCLLCQVNYFGQENMKKIWNHQKLKKIQRKIEE